MEETTWPADENERLYEGLRQKAPWAYKEVYRRFYHPFLKFVLRNSGTQEDAKDAFQDFIVKLYEKEDFKLDDHPKKLPAYLTQFFRNQWFQWLRKRKKMPRTRDLDGLPELSDDNSGLSDKENLENMDKAAEKAFEELGEDCQRLLNLFYFEEKPMREIAELMGYTEAYARQKKFRCMERLRDLSNK